jgi:uncharacterized phage protein (TIGR02216 family)
MPRREWSERLRLAAARYGVTPEAFWRLSLLEWRALTLDAGGEPLARDALEALMTAHPDARERSDSAPSPAEGEET